MTKFNVTLRYYRGPTGRRPAPRTVVVEAPSAQEANIMAVLKSRGGVREVSATRAQ